MREHVFISGFVCAANTEQRDSCGALGQELIFNDNLDREHDGGVTTRARLAFCAATPATVTVDAATHH